MEEENSNNGIDEKIIVEHFREILTKGLKLNLNDENFRETPERVARAYKEIFAGLEHSREHIEKIFRLCFPTTYNGIVLNKNITVFSMCPHHFLPVRYEVSLGYVPDKCTIGLSKMARIVEILAKSPCLQETFTEKIVDEIDLHIKPRGVICIVKGEHTCMQMRGVKQKDVVTTTSAAKGVFLTQQELELKFYELLR